MEDQDNVYEADGGGESMLLVRSLWTIDVDVKEANDCLSKYGAVGPVQTGDKTGSTSQTDQPVASFSFRALSRKQVFVLISMCWCDLSGCLCLSIMAPFFPKVVSQSPLTFVNTNMRLTKQCIMAFCYW